MSLYKLEKSSHISHATLNDLYNEKTNIEKCSSSLVHDIAKSLKMSMDKVYSILSYNDLSLLEYSEAFDLFKSNVCHDLKHLDYKNFLIKHLKNNTVVKYMNDNRIVESLYLLSMIDYLCVTHSIPLVKEYDNIRQYKLDKLYVPKSVYLLLKTRSSKISDFCNESISIFLNHNILETNIYEIR